MLAVRRWPRMAVGLLLVILSALMPLSSASTAFAGSTSSTGSESSPTCQLGSPSGTVQHVIEVVFDNLDFARANPKVPSDLEQMPNLEKFITDNGVLLSNEHTALLGHAANNIVTTLTGVYPDRQGIPVANSYRYYNADGTSSGASAFSYWTSPAATGDASPNMLAADGKNAPAPWVPFTRAGCNVGSVGVANLAIENLSTDISVIFGPNSAQAQEVKDNPNKAQADLEAIAVHCAKGDALCSSTNGGVADKLPDEPGGYDGYQALFGNVSIASQVSPGGPVRDLYGNIIESPTGNYGSPGFNGFSPAVSLGYVADMQEDGVPVTYAYISTPKDANGVDFGPGEPGYVSALKSYDDAFGTFFNRLAHDGITKSNTLFVFSSDEGGHFSGSAPEPDGCDGVSTPCSYSQLGQIDLNLTGLLAQPGLPGFEVQGGMAPAFYIDGNPSSDSSATRDLERAVGALAVTDPYTGQSENVTNYIAGREELKLLHMQTADPSRTPSFVSFNAPDFVGNEGDASCDPAESCVTVDKTSAWTHGTVAQDIDLTWAGFVGPGVKTLGIDASVWSDHTNLRPTMLALLGLHDDYLSDGRVLAEIIESSALPAGIAKDLSDYITLASVYQQLNAPLGAFGQASLEVSTAAIMTNTPANDYSHWSYATAIPNLVGFGRQRDEFAAQMARELNGAAFEGVPVPSDPVVSLAYQSRQVIKNVADMAHGFSPSYPDSFGW